MKVKESTQPIGKIKRYYFRKRWQIEQTLPLPTHRKSLNCWLSIGIFTLDLGTFKRSRSTSFTIRLRKVWKNESCCMSPYVSVYAALSCCWYARLFSPIILNCLLFLALFIYLFFTLTIIVNYRLIMHKTFLWTSFILVCLNLIIRAVCLSRALLVSLFSESIKSIIIIIIYLLFLLIY